MKRKVCPLEGTYLVKEESRNYDGCTIVMVILHNVECDNVIVEKFVLCSVEYDSVTEVKFFLHRVVCDKEESKEQSLKWRVRRAECL